MAAKVFVGNLSYDTLEYDLEALFSQVGQVLGVFLPTDRETQRPRGFAFVEFADETVVPAAIEKFDGFEFHGRPMRVSEARERAPRLPGPSDGGGFSRPKFGKPSKSKGSRRNLRARKRGF